MEAYNSDDYQGRRRDQYESSMKGIAYVTAMLGIFAGMMGIAVLCGIIWNIIKGL